MKITVFYKYQVSDSFFVDTYNNITTEQAQQIEKRYSDNMTAGTYIALQIIKEWD